MKLEGTGGGDGRRLTWGERRTHTHEAVPPGTHTALVTNVTSPTSIKKIN